MYLYSLVDPPNLPSMSVYVLTTEMFIDFNIDQPLSIDPHLGLVSKDLGVIDDIVLLILHCSMDCQKLFINIHNDKIGVQRQTMDNILMNVAD